uniref:Uncharacterized protein n=1 Tax=viral metagenome TaxID=1070528 RepID=A0A6H1ZNU8_9ZZZZ
MKKEDTLKKLLKKQLQEFDCEFTEKDTDEELLRNDRIRKFLSTCQRQIIEEMRERINEETIY